MPRKRPDAAPSIGRLLVGLLLLTHTPLLSNAQQQHLLEPQVTPAVAQGKSTTFDAPFEVPGIAKPRSPSNRRNDRSNPSLSRDERAIATLAPADRGLVPERAVRAPPATRSAAGGLSSRLPARSLQDWEVEDIVLLATVDGTIHARDRRTGQPRWALEADRPMVETVYHPRNKSNDGGSVAGADFLWIVEPSQDGNLYGFTPGSRFGMQRLGLTVKQLVEDLSPYASEDPPVVYTGEKKNTLYTVDISNGKILKVFSAAGSEVIDQGSCKRVDDFLDDEECDAVGTLTLGRTEYTVGVQSTEGEPICTIKYFEWSPNNRDRDLYSQYSKTKDNRYIYSLHDGMVLALDHAETADQNLEFAQKPTYRQKFESPVARVFDVARPVEETAPDTPLIILPQPKGPSHGEVPRFDDEGRIFVNCTEAGSWYALSENIYPLVTRTALPAPSSRENYLQEALDEEDFNQLKDAIVGVHALSHSELLSPDVPLISGPGGEISLPPQERDPQPVPTAESEPILPRLSYMQSLVATLILCFAIAGGRFWPKGSAALQNALKQDGGLTVDLSQPGTPHVVVENPLEVPTVTKSEVTKAVRFEGTEEEPAANVEAQSSAVVSDKEIVTTTSDDANGTVVDDTTPKKKKAHRGKRGGKKLAEKAGLSDKILNGEQLEKIDSSDSVKQAGPVISVKPDHVSNAVDQPDGAIGLGNLKIDTAKVLGNGSGGTFVFEGTFEGRDVAVKRMLPQFFELASQEVSLLEQSEDHPNVIRYFCRREDSNFLYIALELCQASLYDLFKDGRREEPVDDKTMSIAEQISSDPRKVLRQLAEGIKYLHSFRIVHRDIKPQNMLIARPKKNTVDAFPRFVISDFGLCKTLPENVSTLIGTTGNAGTAGWKAPELIFKPKDGTGSSQHSTNGNENSSQNGGPPGIGGVKRAVDIFSLGCVFFYVLTRGQHPFDDEEGWTALRERNIKVGRANLAPLSLFGPDTEDLIRWMLSPLPEDRPTAAQVLQHPFFWDAEERLEFLSIASDRFDQEARDGSSQALYELESHAEEIIPKAIAGAAYSAAHGTLQPTRSHGRSGSNSGMPSGYATQMVLPIAEPNFLAQLDKKFIDTLGKQRRYHPGKLVDLLRALRNKHHHWDDMPDDVKAKVGEVPEGYLRYWEIRFPALVVGVWRVCKDLGIGGERRFWRFYDGRT